MPVVQASLLIRESRQRLFDLSQDYRLRLTWDPFLRDLRFLDGAREAAVGVRVWVRAWTGLTMVVEYVGFRRPDMVAMKMVQGPLFLRKFSGSWLFREHPGGSTEVTFRYFFETRWRWMRFVLEPLVSRVFLRDVRKRLLGLKRGAELAGLPATGETR